MLVTALLPMKGHSERVPNKNIRSFAGKPLYHQVASVLQESGLVKAIIIDTDSDFIAGNAIENFSKAKVVERPQNLRGDFVPMNEIIAHDLSVTEGEHFLQTHSTNPLLTLRTLEEAVRRYFEFDRGHDSLFSVTRLQTRLYWESGEPVNHDPRKLLRTQDLPPLFEENSNLYLFSRNSFTAAGNRRIGLAPRMFPMRPLEAIDIDDEETFELAEAVWAMRKSEHNRRNEGR